MTITQKMAGRRIRTDDHRRGTKQEIFMFVVHANFVGQKKKKKSKNGYNKKISIVPFVLKTGYEAGNGIFRLLSKASNICFSRHVKTGCNLPVCITNPSACAARPYE